MDALHNVNPSKEGINDLLQNNQNHIPLKSSTFEEAKPIRSITLTPKDCEIMVQNQNPNHNTSASNDLHPNAAAKLKYTTIKYRYYFIITK